MKRYEQDAQDELNDALYGDELRDMKRATRTIWAYLRWIIPVVLGLVFVMVVVGYFAGWFGEASRVAQETYGPRAAKEKYEWFKLAHANLEKKRHDIGVAKNQVNSLTAIYKDREPPQDQRDELARLNQNVTDLTMSYNRLAADYNARSSMVTWELFEGSPPHEIQPYSSE